MYRCIGYIKLSPILCYLYQYNKKKQTISTNPYSLTKQLKITLYILPCINQNQKDNFSDLTTASHNPHPKKEKHTPIRMERE